MKDNYKSRIMKNLFNYWFKTNKKSLYDQLGKEFNVSGFRVYKLAHGKTAYSHMAVSYTHLTLPTNSRV